jgi:hypothetical protein
VREGRRVGRSEIGSVIMGIKELHPQPNWVLHIVADDGRVGNFDTRPYLEYDAFNELRDHNEFMKVINGGYFVEWECGADLSADTIEARWQVVGIDAPQMAV